MTAAETKLKAHRSYVLLYKYCTLAIYYSSLSIALWNSLESKIVEVKAKKDLYIARVRSAQASQKLVEMLQKNRAGGFVAAFEQMEDKVMELEAQSLALSELEANELENQFAALENGGDIEGELEALKAQLSDSSPQFDDGKARLDRPEDGDIDH